MSRIIKKKSLSADENHAFLNLICDYAFALDMLDKYDHQTVDDPKLDLKDIYRITLLWTATNALASFCLSGFFGSQYSAIG